MQVISIVQAQTVIIPNFKKFKMPSLFDVEQFQCCRRSFEQEWEIY